MREDLDFNLQHVRKPLLEIGSLPKQEQWLETVQDFFVMEKLFIIIDIPSESQGKYFKLGTGRN